MTSFPGEGTAELVIIDALAHRLELFKRLPRARSATFAPACASAPGGNSAPIENEKRKTPLNNADRFMSGCRVPQYSSAAYPKNFCIIELLVSHRLSEIPGKAVNMASTTI